MLKKSISVLLAVVMIAGIFTIIPVSASAEEISADAVPSETLSSEPSTSYESNVEFLAPDPLDTEEPEDKDQDEEAMSESAVQKETPDLADTGAVEDLAPVGETVNGFTYNVSNKEATITAYNKKDTASLTIPNKIGGCDQSRNKRQFRRDDFCRKEGAVCCECSRAALLYNGL